MKRECSGQREALSLPVGSRNLDVPCLAGGGKTIEKSSASNQWKQKQKQWKQSVDTAHGPVNMGSVASAFSATIRALAHHTLHCAHSRSSRAC